WLCSSTAHSATEPSISAYSPKLLSPSTNHLHHHLPPPLHLPTSKLSPRPTPNTPRLYSSSHAPSPEKNIFSKERKVGRVPSIVFEKEDGQHGGNKRLISVQTNQIRKLVKHLGESFFLYRLFDLEVRSDFGSGELIEKVRVLPRKLHLHAGTDAPLNVTFIRAHSNALLKVDIPLVFRGEDVCPGLRKGLYLNTIKRTVKFLCPADIYLHILMLI
ncbi:50S ribosomal protein L25-like, partial [Hibiscus syriacus]|uniref:50S ribosomal protein L25-like n=1 Tax=Hibiscus syriacus TaxID=106335 RepID=UPI0019212719